MAGAEREGEERVAAPQPMRAGQKGAARAGSVCRPNDAAGSFNFGLFYCNGHTVRTVFL